MEIPTKVGYKFIGWSLDNAFYTDENGDSIKTFDETFNIATLTANWSKIYTITYELDGGTTANVTEYTIESETIVLSNPTKAHYDFVEWQLDGKVVTEIAEEAEIVQEAEIAEETEAETEGRARRNVKSFSERLSLSSSEVLAYYNEIKNELLSYKKVKSKISFKHESFRLGMPVVARLKIRGKSLYLFLAINPNDYKDSKYKIKDVSDISNSKDVPTMYKINLPRRAVYAKELIADLMKKFNAEKSAK